MKKLIIIILSLVPAFGFAQVEDSVQRCLKVEGACNFRDVGGYKTTSGKQVKWGKVYRSADISRLTENDLGLLKARRIYTVVDLRETAESKKAPDRLLPNSDYILCSVTEDVTDWTKQMQQISSGDSMMVAFYSKTETLGKKYKPMFQKLLMLPDTSSILYHCSAGKDRTGIGTALFLYTLGVPMETIVQDYLASNIYRQQENEKLVRILTQNTNVKEAVARDMASAKSTYLEATFKSINQQYGSIENFLKEELGIDKKEIKKLKKKYTI
jgi:protein-tyrosine phosphatase